MSARIGARLRALLALLLLLSVAAARADTPVSLFQAFRGQVNFTGTEETLRTKSNNQPCRLVNSGTAIYAYLGGIPSGAKVLSAQLYWAGSGSSPDYTVTFDGVARTAPSNRRYTSSTIGSGYNYFSGGADVTSQVAAKGNGYYTFSGLTVNNGEPWCSAQGVVGGFSLLVVYSHPSEAYRLLNVYEGFQYFRNSGFTLTLNNFAIPSPLPASATGRVGHITWEGDGTLSGGGEDLLFNGYEMIDSLNPSGNQFNSASNVTGDTRSYGIDFDAYTVGYPVIKSGQTTATTTYRSGQDMVLLSAEVAALPYIPVADLALAMTRSGALQVGSTASYALTVTNNGADTETGPVTVVDTLPAGLALVSARGAGWSCTSAAGAGSQTVVTCSASGPVASGASMSTLTITVNPTKAGNYSNSATVSGKTNDSNSANNTASDATSATDPNAGATANLIFTAKACSANDAITDPWSATGCPRFSGRVTAGDAAAAIYITNVANGTSGQVATALSTSQSSSLAAQLTLACTWASGYSGTGVKASYAGLTLACNGSAQAQTLVFAAGSPSAAAGAFSYLDVGKLNLKLGYNSSSIAQDIVSRPASVGVFAVLRASDNVADLHGQSNPPDVAFARAGEDFLLQLNGVMANGRNAPSFGYEAQKPSVGVTVSSPANHDTTLNIADFGGAARDAASAAGLLVGRLDWYEAGMLTLDLSLGDYLGTGAVGGVSRQIGRFYPDHFTTDLVAPFVCLPAMACPAPVPDPANPVYGVGGAAYSGQPVNFSVTAYGLDRGSDPTVLQLYNPTQPLTLSAVSQPNGSQPPSPGSYPGFTIQATPQTDKDGNVTYRLTGTVRNFQLAVPYNPAAPHAGNWSAPLAVYLRATLQDQMMTASSSTPQPFSISSQIVPTQAVPTPPQQEDGVMLLAGRLFVGNVFGSELARVPLPLTAQYWTGAAWQTNSSDDASVVATSLKFSNCTRSFVGNCQLAVLGVSAAPTAGGPGLQLATGIGRLTLKAPARGQNGSLDITVQNDATGTTAFSNPGAATWLPSTTGRASFGLFKSPLIYLREVY